MKESRYLFWADVVKKFHSLFMTAYGIVLLCMIGALILGEFSNSSFWLGIFRIFAVAFYGVTFTMWTSQLLFWGCPLTKLENMLRREADPRAKLKRSFIGDTLEGYGIHLKPGVITVVLLGITIGMTLLVLWIDSKIF